MIFVLLLLNIFFSFVREGWSVIVLVIFKNWFLGMKMLLCIVVRLFCWLCGIMVVRLLLLLLSWMSISIWLLLLFRRLRKDWLLIVEIGILFSRRGVDNKLFFWRKDFFFIVLFIGVVIKWGEILVFLVKCWILFLIWWL